MINKYNTNGKVLDGDVHADKPIWLDVINPTEAEIEYLVTKLGVEANFLTSALDIEESSRIDVKNGQTLIVISAPFRNDDSKREFETIPVSILIMDQLIVTISLKELKFLNEFKTNGITLNSDTKKSTICLQLIYAVVTQYLKNLNTLKRETYKIEDALYVNMEDKQFIGLLKIEKTLVFFETALSSNKSVVDKLYRGNYINLADQNQVLLDDISIELDQAIEMASKSAAIIRSIRDGISSLMSNKLNITMQALAAITIILTIPTMVFSFYGMNVNLGNTHFWFYPLVIIGVTALITLVIYRVMKRRKFF